MAELDGHNSVLKGLNHNLTLTPSPLNSDHVTGDLGSEGGGRGNAAVYPDYPVSPSGGKILASCEEWKIKLKIIT